MKLDEFCSKLHTSLSLEQSDESRLEMAATFVSRAFTINPDEVAIFLLDDNREFLGFIWPRHLKDAGTIPVSAVNPLVARTAREKKGFLNNSFAVTPHASFFELFHGKEKHSLPIQKIMSAPLTREGQVVGVIQVSRKAEDVAGAGADFSRDELFALEKIATVIAGCL